MASSDLNDLTFDYLCRPNPITLLTLTTPKYTGLLWFPLNLQVLSKAWTLALTVTSPLRRQVSLQRGLFLITQSGLPITCPSLCICLLHLCSAVQFKNVSLHEGLARIHDSIPTSGIVLSQSGYSTKCLFYAGVESMG